MIYYLLNIFLSAFLLFQVQPLLARYILPWFGGTPAVWSTVQLFFQVCLTAGYGYSSWLVARLPARKQSWTHIALLASSLAVLAVLGLLWPSPITPDASWRPASIDFPVADILRLLLAAVGLPFLLLATTSPLTQAWFSRAFPGRSPYWLYALSNMGSLLGLLAYPFLIEPNLTLRQQGWVWSGGYALFVILCAYAALKSRRPAAAVPATATEPAVPGSGPSSRVQVLWILLSAIAATIYLGTANQLSQEVAAIPFLWVLPLAIYLLSFVLTYSGQRWYSRRVFGILLIVASLGLVWSMADPGAPLVALIGVFCFVLFVSVMICNGEIYQLRPDPGHLTRFYLMTSLGGALGGVFVNLIAPLIFNGYWELPIGFLLIWQLLLVVWITRKSRNTVLRTNFMHHVLLGAMALLVGLPALYTLAGGKTPGALFEKRNFYGVVHVVETDPDDPQLHAYGLVNGGTLHGLQYVDPSRHDLPTTYYVEQGGAGLALLNHPKRGSGMRVGVLGLGIGTLAAYARPGDTYRFYDINPLVIELAGGQGGYFSFLADSRAQTAVVPGDARISIERELASGQRQAFDVLVLDVFSGDTIPVHLMTKEAFADYLQDLAPGGILAVHISNRYLDLKPVFWQLARAYGMDMRVVTTPGGVGQGSSSTWVLLARDPAVLQIPAIAAHAVSMQGYTTTVPLWTDDFSNLFQLVK